jgi:hypothetical protein
LSGWSLLYQIDVVCMNVWWWRANRKAKEALVRKVSCGHHDHKASNPPRGFFFDYRKKLKFSNLGNPLTHTLIHGSRYVIH